MTLVNREAFLRQLEAVRPGVSARDVVEQSSCIVFVDGEVLSYNDEVSVRAPSALNGEVRGAVDAKPLFDLLAKLVEDEVDVTQGDGVLTIKGKKRGSDIRLEAEVVLPVGAVDKPKQWTQLPEEFIEALKVVGQCAGKDGSQFISTCVNFHPKWLEASDDTQVVRYRTKTGIESPTLIRGESAKAVAAMEPLQIAQTESWLHFKNHAGVVMSVRRYVEEFPSAEVTAGFKEPPGDLLALPKGLGEAADKASIFAADDPADVKVEVSLRPGKLRIVGRGARGRYWENKKVNYQGQSIQFLISPTLLTELVKKHNECHVSADKLRVDGGKMSYICALGVPQEEEPAGEVE